MSEKSVKDSKYFKIKTRNRAHEAIREMAYVVDIYGWSERDWTGPNLNSVIADYNSMSDLLEDIQALKVLDDLNDDLLVECARRVVDHGSRNRYYFRNSKR